MVKFVFEILILQFNNLTDMNEAALQKSKLFSNQINGVKGKVSKVIKSC